MATKYDLQNAYLFHELSEVDLSRIVDEACEQVYETGEYVYKKGDDGDNFFVIADGKVELIVEKQNSIACVAGHIGAGGHFGEGALLTQKRRSISVRTLTKTRLLSFNREKFESILLENRKFHRSLDKALAERLSLASQGEHDFGLTIQPLQSSQKSISQHHSLEDDFASSSHLTPNIHLNDDFDLAKNVKKMIDHFAETAQPLLITGETGTGRRLAAKQIHLRSGQELSPYIELDLRQFEPWIWEGKLFGYQKDTFPFSTGRQLGIFEQLNSGTVVLHHVELLSNALQKKIYETLKSGMFSPIDSEVEQPLRIRLILVSETNFQTLQHDAVFIPELLNLLEKKLFVLPPLREHKRDIPFLVNYYLKLYNSDLSKNVTKISPDALGILMKYDWPGNLSELSNVIHRAMMLCPKDQIISEQILLGMPRTEGKLVFNLLRIPAISKTIKSKLFLVIPKILIGLLFSLGIITLFFGPNEAEKNIGITLSWYIGWPLLIFSFFFLPRFWCSVCALSAPGKLLQTFIRPTRRLPAVITTHSSWIMALLCLIVFWVEIVWNAYENPVLTGFILLSIASGAFLFSVLFERYSWCRYVCPLGGLNAIFSMPSILEVRANRQMCENQCQDHACYRGTEDSPGCPMFRHPFLVDNNKDCILCGRCIKNCRLHSTQLNLRLAPQELWFIQSPKLADSMFVVALGVILIMLAQHTGFLRLPENFSRFNIDESLTLSLIFWGGVALSWCVYFVLCRVQAFSTGEDYKKIRSALGYGFIPLILGGYLAIYVKMFLHGSWRLFPNFLNLFGIETTYRNIQFLSEQGESTLVHIIILGGLLSSLYATYKIVKRLEMKKIELIHLVFPYIFILSLGFHYLHYI